VVFNPGAGIRALHFFEKGFEPAVEDIYPILVYLYSSIPEFLKQSIQAFHSLFQGKTTMAIIHLPYGNQSLEIDVMDEYFGEVLLPNPVKPDRPADQSIQESLNHPIGSPRLKDMVKRDQRIAILIDDNTRMTPVHQLLPPILAELQSTGIPKQNIRIVIALGTHRPMTAVEIVNKIGAGTAGEYQIINETSSSQSDVVYLGETTHHIPVWVHRAVAEADFRIGLGEITPHIDAGFSGGAKILLPGVCGPETIDALHVRSAESPNSQIGMIDAPFRLELERFVCEHIPLHFILNVIVNLEGEIYRCAAGDSIAAHRAGIRFAQEVFGTVIQRRFPIVIAGSYPHQSDFWQSEKGLICGALATADGGSLILVTHAEEGNSNYALFPHYIGMDPEALKRDLDDGKVENRMLAANAVMIGRMKQRINFCLISSGLSRADAEVMGFNYYSTVEEAILDAVQNLPPQARKASIGILPQAGITLPLFRPEPTH
jgi:nickel-dependent lactate racemase